MSEWFRNQEWNEEVAARFEERLARARRKAEYLCIQGYGLLTTRPEVASDLLQRAAALDDPAQTGRAWLYLGTARAMAGDIDGAIAALESAIEAERRHPMHRTAAGLDQALLIALAERTDLYDLALARLLDESVLPFAEQHLSALIAQALIRGERGEDVAAMAAAALAALGEGDGGWPSYLTVVARLKDRLAALSVPPAS